MLNRAHEHEKSNRVKFIAEHMENYDLENSALHRKLQSKNEALKIMRAEVERFRMERDQFKLMAETVQMRYAAMKSSLENSENNDTFSTSSSTLGFLLNQTREKNLALQTETETLRQKLHELQGDIKLLRNKNLEMTKLLKTRESKSREQGADELQKRWNEEKSKLIDQLEGLKKKNAQLQFDFRSLLDEKEEIVTERDAFKCKAHRLNHELSATLKGNETVDFDALILESKFLQDRVTNLESELEHSRKSNNKMQSLLEQKRVKGGIIKLGDNRNNQMIMSHKQVKKLLNDGTVAELPLKAATIADLKALCLALLDNLNDKSTALSHQKKTNRLLAAKIATLEQNMAKLTGDPKSHSLLSPAQFLLNGYTSSKVDEDLRLIKEVVLHKNSAFGESSESNKSLMSSEIETQSTSDISAEFRHLNYIKILNDDEIDDDCIEEAIEDCESELKLGEQTTELADLPPDIQKLVDEAMRNAENDDNKKE